MAENDKTAEAATDDAAAAAAAETAAAETAAAAAAAAEAMRPIIRKIIVEDGHAGAHAVSYTHLTLPTICSV